MCAPQRRRLALPVDTLAHAWGQRRIRGVTVAGTSLGPWLGVLNRVVLQVIAFEVLSPPQQAVEG